MILHIICLIIGFVIGVLAEIVYEYHKSLREFNKRQERYRKMI